MLKRNRLAANIFYYYIPPIFLYNGDPRFQGPCFCTAEQCLQNVAETCTNTNYTSNEDYKLLWSSQEMNST